MSNKSRRPNDFEVDEYELEREEKEAQGCEYIYNSQDGWHWEYTGLMYVYNPRDGWHWEYVEQQGRR